MKRGEKLCKIIFNAENKLGVKFRLTKEFLFPAYTYMDSPNAYWYVDDTDIFQAISKFCEKEELRWWLDDSGCEIGGPPWRDICNLHVTETESIILEE